jgi:predicted aspartyl protease
MGHCFLVLTLLTAVRAIVAADTRSAAPIPLVHHKDGRIELAVRINGEGPFRFRLDTGASRTVISARLATRLGLPPAGQSRTITHTGQGFRALVRVDQLVLGTAWDQPVADVLGLVLQPEEIDRPGRVDGLLGQDVLSRWVYTIDYRAGRLLLSPDPSASGRPAVRLPLERSSGGWLAAVAVGDAAEPLRLVPDSGADRLVLFAKAQARLPLLTLLETVRVRSVTGDAMARLVRLDTPRVGGIRIGEHQALLLDAGPSGGEMGDGLLPLHLFARVTFDLAESSLWLEPRH